MADSVDHITSEQWRALCIAQGHIIARMADGLRGVREFLTNPAWGTCSYMEGADVYSDISRNVAEIDIALGVVVGDGA